MPLYNPPRAIPLLDNRTSNLGRNLNPSVRLDSALPSDLILRARGVRFESFNPFPIIRAGELFDTQRGDHLVVRTKVGGAEQDVTTVDVGAASRLVITGASLEAQQQAVSQVVEETSTSVVATNVLSQTPLTQEQIAPGQIEVTGVGPGTAVVQESDVTYAVVDPALAAAQQAAANEATTQQLLAESAARAAERAANTTLTSPTGQVYTSPSQSLTQQGVQPGVVTGGGNSPVKTGGGLRNQAQNLTPDPEIVLLQQMGLL